VTRGEQVHSLASCSADAASKQATDDTWLVADAAKFSNSIVCRAVNPAGNSECAWNGRLDNGRERTGGVTGFSGGAPLQLNAQTF